MSPIETERFVKEMRSSFKQYVDVTWGPLPDPWSGPVPQPWRELSIAYDVVKLADYLELAAEGLGQGMVNRFADEPLDPCGTRIPGWPFPPPKGGGSPQPGEEEPIVNLSMLGAALHFVAEGVGSPGVKEAAIAAGNSILARG
ncbi:MAG: hypothetical protein ABW065_01710 [Solirubrobacterales bacterium]